MRTGRDKSKQQDVVYGITDAPKPLSQDIRSRESGEEQRVAIEDLGSLR